MRNETMAEPKPDVSDDAFVAWKVAKMKKQLAESGAILKKAFEDSLKAKRH